MQPPKPSFLTWLSLVAGLVLVVSPWIFGFSGAEQEVANAVVAGLLIAAMSALALATHKRLATGWVNFVLLNVIFATEAIIGPQLLKFSDMGSAVSVVVGLLVIAFAMIEMWRATGPSTLLTI